MLIVAPTRELAMQSQEVLEEAGQSSNIRRNGGDVATAIFIHLNWRFYKYSHGVSLSVKVEMNHLFSQKWKCFFTTVFAKYFGSVTLSGRHFLLLYFRITAFACLVTGYGNCKLFIVVKYFLPSSVCQSTVEYRSIHRERLWKGNSILITLLLCGANGSVIFTLGFDTMLWIQIHWIVEPNPVPEFGLIKKGNLLISIHDMQ